MLKALAVAAVLTLAVVLGLHVTTGSDPVAAPRSTSASPSPTASSSAPATIIPGAHFGTRILTLDELKTKYAAEGKTYVSGDPSKPTTFVSASYNVLGSSHAKNGPSRAARGGSLLRSKGVSVVGLQELQSNQRSSLLNASGFTSYPAESGLNGENSIAWDPDVWQLVDGEMQSIPYFFGKNRQMPIVLLRHIETGRMMWWMNVHNPADVFGCKCGGWRAKAVAVEVAKINVLHADGTPVFFTGDLNDRSAVVCKVAVGTGMRSADGSYAAGGKGGSCRQSGSLWIDWIWGSGDQVEFADYDRDYRTRNSPRMSDHPMITSTTTIAPANADQACTKYKRHEKTYWFCPDPTLSVGQSQ